MEDIERNYWIIKDGKLLPAPFPYGAGKLYKITNKDKWMKEKYNEEYLEEKIEDLEGKVNDLNYDLRKLKNKWNWLKVEVKYVRYENNELKRKMDFIKEENKNLKKKLKKSINDKWKRYRNRKKKWENNWENRKKNWENNWENRKKNWENDWKNIKKNWENDWKNRK